VERFTGGTTFRIDGIDSTQSRQQQQEFAFCGLTRVNLAQGQQQVSSAIRKECRFDMKRDCR
jgi:hypothetical protein